MNNQSIYDHNYFTYRVGLMRVARNTCSSILKEAAVPASSFIVWERKNHKKEKCKKHRHAIHPRVSLFMVGWTGQDTEFSWSRCVDLLLTATEQFDVAVYRLPASDQRVPKFYLTTLTTFDFWRLNRCKIRYIH